MRAVTHVKGLGAVVVFASIGVLLGVAALVTALAIKPPAIGWVGFGVVSVGIALTPFAVTQVIVPSTLSGAGSDRLSEAWVAR